MTTWHGQRPDQGRVEIGGDYPGEGYAVLRCGNTEVKIGFTMLTHVSLDIPGDHPFFAVLADLQKAIYAITAEASMGRTGDDEILP